MILFYAQFLGAFAAEPGPYFGVTSSNSIYYETYQTEEEFKNDLLQLNPILTPAQAEIEWVRGVDTDFSKFDGIDFEVPDEIYSIKWLVKFSVFGYAGKRTANVPFRMEFQFNKEPEGTDRDFNNDLEVIYATEWKLKMAMNNMQISNEMKYLYMYEGRTDVDLFILENDEYLHSGECFRTTATKGYCTCGWANHPFVLDWESKCVHANKFTTSCEFTEDIRGSFEEGRLECPEGYEIRVLKYGTLLGRQNSDTCSAAKTDDKRSQKRYAPCDRSDMVREYIQEKCNGQQTCDYKYYDGEFPTGDKKLKKTCKKQSRYVTIQYACSKLANTPPPPTGEPDGYDICESCAETGFTKETACAYTGLSFHGLATNQASYEGCLAECNNSNGCKAFVFYEKRVGTRNCFLKRGVLDKSCTGEALTFSRKCELAKCYDKTPCAISRIPFFVDGPFAWVCSESDGTTTCQMKCQDGYNQLGVTSTCGESDEWQLNSPTERLSEYVPGCHTCSSDPINKYPIPFGGTWECDVSDSNKKVCLPKCSNKQQLSGSVTCMRNNKGYSETYVAPTDSYVGDKKLLKSISKEEHTCYNPTCKKSDLVELVEEYAAQNGWDVDLGESDFTYYSSGTGFDAYLNCPNTNNQSKTKCNCKVKKGKRKFKCADLTNPKKC